jgi:hypothetical protein
VAEIVRRPDDRVADMTHNRMGSVATTEGELPVGRRHAVTIAATTIRRLHRRYRPS